MFKTTCEKCVFAKYNSDNVQVGCHANRLEKFTEQNVTSFVANKTEKSYYVINGRRCNLCHQQSWADYQNNQEIDPLTLDQLYDIARLQVRPKIIMSIYCSQKSLDGLTTTLKSIYAQEIRPYRIHIVNVAESYPVVQLMIDKFNDIPWKITKSSTETIPAKQLDDSFRETKGQFYAIVNEGSVCPDDWTNMIDKRVNEDIEMLFYDMPDRDCLLIQSILYWMLPPDWLDDQDEIVTKIKQTLKELECPTPLVAQS